MPSISAARLTFPWHCSTARCTCSCSTWSSGITCLFLSIASCKVEISFSLSARLCYEIGSTVFQSFHRQLHIGIGSYQDDWRIGIEFLYGTKPEESVLTRIDSEREIHVEQYGIYCLFFGKRSHKRVGRRQRELYARNPWRDKSSEP